ncbi:hypothetical protein BDR06DRAFT_1015995 [Suillus hirtellus]|nr:hypothetical protein BDR06DRAFT_1015995 [Suillus hirtellus]
MPGDISSPFEIHQGFPPINLNSPINIFINSANELFGPITTIQHSGLTKHIPWSAFTFGSSDWDCVENACIIISDANGIQQYCSSESQPTLWHAIPAFKELKMAWEWKCDMPKYELYQLALQKGLEKVNKYYQKMDEKCSFKHSVKAPVFTVEEVPAIASIVELPESRDLSDNAGEDVDVIPRDTLGMFQSLTAAVAHVMMS